MTVILVVEVIIIDSNGDKANRFGLNAQNGLWSGWFCYHYIDRKTAEYIADKIRTYGSVCIKVNFVHVVPFIPAV